MARKRKTPKRNAKGRFVKKSSTARRKARRTTSSTKRKSTSAKRTAAARKAARTRAANKRKRSAAARKAARTRRRNPSTRRRVASRPTGAARSYRRNPARRRKTRRTTAPRRRTVRRMRRNPSSGRYRDAKGRFTKQRGVPTLSRARRYIKKPPSGPAKAYKKRFKMRSNPASVIDGMLQAVPVALSLYGSRYITNRLGPQIPGMDALGQFRGPAQAGLVALLIGFVGKRVRPLAQYRGAALMGASINVADSLVQAFAPPRVARAFGISSAAPALPPEEAPEGQGEYLQVGEYMQIGPGGGPVDTSLTLGEYVSVDGLEAELGGLEADLGYEGPRAALGAGGFADRNLGGVSRGAHGRARARRMQSRRQIPSRSMTGAIDHFGPDSVEPDQLYTGVFAGGGSIGG